MLDYLEEFERRLEQRVDRRAVRQRIRRRRRQYRIAAVSLVVGCAFLVAVMVALAFFALR